MVALRRRRLRRPLTVLAAMRRRIQQFGPYRSMALLLVPLIIVEPVKLAGMAFVGLGHWFGGVCMIIGGYAAGLLVVDRLYRVVKSKIYMLPWCAFVTGEAQAFLARWRWGRMIKPSRSPSRSNVVTIPRTKKLESMLSLWSDP